jgi:cytochrome c oxidase subunit II
MCFMLPVPIDVVAPTVAIYTNLLNWYLFLGFAAGAVVTVWMMYNIFTNRAKHVKEAPKYHEEEGGWGNWKTVLMTLLVTGSVLAFVEYETFASVGLIVPPAGDPITIGVTGQQFAWVFTYPNGHVQVDNLTVPQDEIVVLNITSIDVDHSFSIQSLDVGKDALPGEYSTVWFNATNLGTFVHDIRCREICGVGHATMIGNFTVVTQQAYNTWYTGLTAVASTTSSSGPPTGPTMMVTIPSGIGSNQQLNFEPSTLTVAAGTTIVFVNKDTSIHDIDFTSVPSGAILANNPSPNTNTWSSGQFSVTLTVPGTYTYVCDYHSWMKGTITVTG